MALADGGVGGVGGTADGGVGGTAVGGTAGGCRRLRDQRAEAAGGPDPLARRRKGAGEKRGALIRQFERRLVAVNGNRRVGRRSFIGRRKLVGGTTIERERGRVLSDWSKETASPRSK